MNNRLNSESYWDHRFSTGDWTDSGGKDQTRLYAEALVERLDFPSEFEGSILDFGCALGDAIPVYRKAFPHADLWGMDHSQNAVSRCRQSYGDLAKFSQGDQNEVPFFDVIIASHILEHLDDDLEVAGKLLTRCGDLLIVVPYKETPLCREHVHYYDENYYLSLGNYSWKIFPKIPAKRNAAFFWNYYFRNLARFCLGRKWVHIPQVILFHFSSDQNRSQPDMEQS